MFLTSHVSLDDCCIDRMVGSGFAIGVSSAATSRPRNADRPQGTVNDRTGSPRTMTARAHPQWTMTQNMGWDV